MTKKMIKVFVIVLIAIMLVLTTTAFAEEQGFSAKNYSIKNMYDNAHDNSGASGALSSISGAILTMVQVVGTGVAIIMLIVLAIKYISAAPSDKAEIKKHAVVYVIGAVVLFAATGILQIVKNFATGNINTQMSAE